MKYTRLAAVIAGTASTLYLTGCVTSTPGPVVVQPVAQPARATVVVTTPLPPRPPVVIAQPVVREELIPERNDVYITAAADSDIIFVGGSTYIWVTGADGRRHRHLYGRGDRRQEIFHRRENLHSVMTHHAGHPPPAYSHHDPDRRREAIHHEQRMHAASMHDRGHAPEQHRAANDWQHHPDPQHQPAPVHNRPVREASAEHTGSQHRPDAGNAAAQGRIPGKS